MSENYLNELFHRHDQTLRWKAEKENATARLELAQMRERAMHLMSQYEPTRSLGLDRDRLRLALEYVANHGDLDRLSRDLTALAAKGDA